MTAPSSSTNRTRRRTSSSRIADGTRSAHRPPRIGRARRRSSASRTMPTSRRKRDDHPEQPDRDDPVPARATSSAPTRRRLPGTGVASPAWESTISVVATGAIAAVAGTAGVRRDRDDRFGGGRRPGLRRSACGRSRLTRCRAWQTRDGASARWNAQRQRPRSTTRPADARDGDAL